MSPALPLARARTLLFVPGDRPERFSKAFASAADAVIIDLEDAVAPARRRFALEETVRALSRGELAALVRVHPPSDPLHLTELTALLRAPLAGLRGLVVAKADDQRAIAGVAARLGPDLALIPLVESATGLVNARELAEAPGVTRLAFGAVDYSGDIGARPVPAALDFARSALVVASRVAGIASPLDSPPLSIVDLEAVRAGAAHARSLGFGGGLAIHPAQLKELIVGFGPTADEVEWAHAVLAAEGDAGAGQVDGQLADRPVFERARTILREREER